ncbi:sigma-70 family RNA polymerase sigma factor [candidate division KSB1 bacterium]|nr:sigma-70 family RNA polymerase sigma factor [candidate division KSB1 bacterium]
MTKAKEIELVKRIAAGDQSGETELFAHFNLRIIRKVRLSLGAGNEDWQDVVSEIQLAILASLRKGMFDLQKEIPLGSYVYGIMMNKIRDYFKVAKKRAMETQISSAHHDIGAEDEPEFEKQEIRLLVKNKLEKLRLKYKEVLYLRYYKNLSISQISAEIDLPPRRVSERLNYAIKLLRKECENSNLFSILQNALIITL